MSWRRGETGSPQCEVSTEDTLLRAAFHGSGSGKKSEVETISAVPERFSRQTTEVEFTIARATPRARHLLGWPSRSPLGGTLLADKS